MSHPSHCLPRPISWQEVRNIWFPHGIEPGPLRCKLVVLTIIPSLLISREFHFFLIPITTVQDLPWIHSCFLPLHKTFFLAPSSPGINQVNPHDTNHEQQSIFLHSLAIQFPPCHHLIITQSSMPFWR